MIKGTRKLKNLEVDQMVKLWGDLWFVHQHHSDSESTTLRKMSKSRVFRNLPAHVMVTVVK